jgi:drug/metabolite transporter (DMT)-like permease
VSAALPYLAVWTAVLFWGASFVAARVVLDAGVSPTVLAALRFSIASIFFLVPIVGALSRRRVTAIDWLKLALMGQAAFALYFWLQYTGLQRTNATVAAILVVGTTPLCTAVLSRLMGIEALTLGRVLALLLGFAGVAVIALQGGWEASADREFLFGAACLIGNALVFAAYSNIGKAWLKDLSPTILTGGTMVGGTAGLLVLSTGESWEPVYALGRAEWGAVLFLAVACSVAGYGLYNYALSKLDASRAASAIFFEPVVAGVLAAILLGESLTGWTIAGTGLITISVALVMRPT